MAVKYFELPNIGKVAAYKRKGSRSIRVSVTSEGLVRLTLPYWVPYKAGLNFIQSKADWIAEQQTSLSVLLNNQAIGKAHHLILQPDYNALKVSSRLRGTEAIVSYPSSLKPNDVRVQKAAKAVSIRALRKEAEKLLSSRLSTLAIEHGFSYKSVSVRQLKTRWGSCNIRAEIYLNIFIMQLPWHLIDYVLMHELTHTKVMHHGPKFWQEFESHLPEVKKLRREIRQYKSTF
jgi:predicted metal-dependent hydrolase